MDRKKLQIVESAFKQISICEGKTVNEIKKEIKKAMRISLCNQDPKIQSYWKRIPCESDIPTPEEFLAFLVDESKKKF
ncbi:MAG: hypothetical protein N2Z65_02080 [Clostridiales bacterium]|nr:hypothetical protein [Clostridiales bacterium]